MNELQEAKLINHYRNLWAKRLRRERRLYKEGLEAVQKHSYWTLDFIKSRRITHFSDYGNSIDFDTLQKEVLKARLCAGIHDTIADIELDTIAECDSSEPTIEVFSVRYELSKLSTVKRLICGSIRNIIRDAKFKLERQANGRDAKRYLKIIDE